MNDEHSPAEKKTEKYLLPTTTIPLLSAMEDAEVVNVEKSMGLTGIELATPSLPALQENIDNRRWGNYVVLGVIKKTSLRLTLLVRDENLHRYLIMKVLCFCPELEQYHMQRFLEEGQILAQLENPTIAPIHDSWLDVDGQMYFTMRYVPGKTLVGFLEHNDTKMPILKKILLFRRICEGIAYIHHQGVCHRNLTADNIWIDQANIPYILGWRALKVKNRGTEIFGADANHKLRLHGKLQTIDGELLGDILYMAPEFFMEKIRHMDERVDIYALGAVLYYILLGMPPFKRQNLGSSIDAVLTPSRRIPDTQTPFRINQKLKKILQKALAFSRTDRYSNCDEMIADLDNLILKHRSWF